MASLRSEIGQLTSLFAFEAAGRLGNFTRAAEELGVTQAAVSKQIVALEARLGQKLFDRKARCVALTAAGQDLYATTAFALGAVARTMRDLQRPADRPLTIALSVPLSQFWLMPRLPEFTARHPNLPIRIIAQDAPQTAKDADFIITFIGHDEPTDGAAPLFGAQIIAMAAPDVLRAQNLATMADVARAPLIHYDAPDRSWLTWRDWAVAAKQAVAGIRPALSVSRYQDALTAAGQGQGVVLVWCIDGRPLIAKGDLVAVPGPILPAPGAFYLRQGDDRTGMAEVAAWLAQRD